MNHLSEVKAGLAHPAVDYFTDSSEHSCRDILYDRPPSIKIIFFNKISVAIQESINFMSATASKSAEIAGRVVNKALEPVFFDRLLAVTIGVIAAYYIPKIIENSRLMGLLRAMDDRADKIRAEDISKSLQCILDRLNSSSEEAMNLISNKTQGFTMPPCCSPTELRLPYPDNYHLEEWVAHNLLYKYTLRWADVVKEFCKK